MPKDPVVVQYYFPRSLSPNRLDRYLAGGWFRAASMMYRSHLLCIEGDVFSVIHIRVSLKDYRFKRGFRKILNRNGKRFRYETGPALITPEKEQLYQKQKHKFKGFINDSLHDFLYSDFNYSLFDTREICVYEGEKLVAISFFDQGQDSLASILGLYDQEYRSSSLGIYTMLLEIKEGLANQKKFYYPGYVLDKYSGFDYKLRLGNIQYYNGNGRWRPSKYIEEESWMAEKLKEKVQLMESSLATHNIAYKRWLYPFYSVGYFDFFENELVRSCVFLLCQDIRKSSSMILIEYRIEEDCFMLSRVSPRPEYQSANIVSNDLLDRRVYYLKLLGYDWVILQHRSAHEIAQKLSEFAF